MKRMTDLREKFPGLRFREAKINRNYKKSRNGWSSKKVLSRKFRAKLTSAEQKLLE